eukprot:7838007-Lingulodinium_polyedra.AAC.1
MHLFAWECRPGDLLQQPEGHGELSRWEAQVGQFPQLGAHFFFWAGPTLQLLHVFLQVALTEAPRELRHWGQHSPPEEMEANVASADRLVSEVLRGAVAHTGQVAPHLKGDPDQPCHVLCKGLPQVVLDEGQSRVCHEYLKGSLCDPGHNGGQSEEESPVPCEPMEPIQEEQARLGVHGDVVHQVRQP